MIDASALATARTLLFVPGSRPARFDKAAASGADLTIVDLEDAVAPSDKLQAREAVADWLAAGGRALIRVNAVGTPWHTDDVRLAQRFSAPIMLAKASSSTAIDEIHTAARVPIIALVETARGVLNANQIAAAEGVVRLALGHIDLASELGVAPDDRTALLSARSTLVLASAASGIAAPIDGVTTTLDDEPTLGADTAYAYRLGFAGKLCIHPTQIGPVHRALAPSDSDVSWAKSTLAAAETGEGAFAHNGQMVDPPVLERARRIIAAVSG